MKSADPALDRIAERLAALLPSGTGIGAARPSDPGLLLPGERAAIARAVPARRREFAGGRQAARAALAQLAGTGLVAAAEKHRKRPENGLWKARSNAPSTARSPAAAEATARKPDETAIPMGTDRAPIWPDGLCGSITHAADLCLAAASADPALVGLGIDLEPDEALPLAVMAEVLRPEERDLPARLVFSAKEAVFKALYPTVGAVFGFDAVRLSLTSDRFTAETQHRLGPVPPGTRLTGRYWRGGGLILTALAVPLAALHLDSAGALL